MANKTYIEELWCPICDKFTKQEIYDSGHERDSSNDSQTCLDCGAYYSGFTGEWIPKEEEGQ